MLAQLLKSLVKDTAVYGIAGAVTKFLAIFSVPILTRILNKSEYGTIDIVLTFVFVFNSVIVFGQDSAIGRFFYDKNEFHYRRKVATIGFLIQGFILILFFIILFIFMDEIGVLFFSNERNIIPFWKIGILSIPGSILTLYAIKLA